MCHLTVCESLVYNIVFIPHNKARRDLKYITSDRVSELVSLGLEAARTMVSAEVS